MAHVALAGGSQFDGQGRATLEDATYFNKRIGRLEREMGGFRVVPFYAAVMTGRVAAKSWRVVKVVA